MGASGRRGEADVRSVTRARGDSWRRTDELSVAIASVTSAEQRHQSPPPALPPLPWQTLQSPEGAPPPIARPPIDAGCGPAKLMGAVM